LEGVLDDALELAEPLDLKVEADVPKHLLLKADRTSVGMIAQNLVENAVKYNIPGGRIRVEARVVNGLVEMTVGNTGDGIPKDRRGRILGGFSGFWGGGLFPGTGLGWSTAGNLAGARGGVLGLVLSNNSGREMRVPLPRDA